MSSLGFEYAAQVFTPLVAAASVASAAFVGWLVKDRLDMYKTDPKSSLPLPPGSFGWPLIGETLEIINNGFDPMPWHKKYGKIYKTSLIVRKKMIVIFDPELIQEFFKKHQGILKRPTNAFNEIFFKDALINLSGPAHKSLRATLLPAFSVRNMRRYVVRTQNLVQHFLDKWESAGQLNAQKELTDMTFMVSAAFFLGADRSFTDKLREHFTEFSKGAFAFILHDLPFMQFRQSKRAYEKLMEYITKVIEQRRQEIKDGDAAKHGDNEDSPTDPLWIMINQKDEEGNYLPSDVIATNSLLLLIAGFDTTKSSLIGIVYKLLEYPEVRRKLRAEIHETIGSGDEPFTLEQINSMSYLDGFLEEVFRTMPVFLFQTDRQTTQTVEVGGYQIPAGWFVACQRYVVGQNDDVFPNAEKFDPERAHDFKVPSTGAKLRNMSLFGFGPYQCLGQHFAQLERKVFTVMLLRNFDLELLSDTLPQTNYKTSFLEASNEFLVRLKRL